jgi:hypothetical protein
MGIKLRKKPKLTQHQIAQAVIRRGAGEVLREKKNYNVSHSTISRL